MSSPKHKILFGIPSEAPSEKQVIPDGGGTAKAADWTFDSTQTVFSSSVLRFDMDKDLETLINENS